jgi:hypothetical protein
MYRGEKVSGGYEYVEYVCPPSRSWRCVDGTRVYFYPPWSGALGERANDWAMSYSMWIVVRLRRGEAGAVVVRRYNRIEERYEYAALHLYRAEPDGLYREVWEYTDKPDAATVRDAFVRLSEAGVEPRWIRRALEAWLKPAGINPAEAVPELRGAGELPEEEPPPWGEYLRGVWWRRLSLCGDDCDLATYDADPPDALIVVDYNEAELVVRPGEQAALARVYYTDSGEFVSEVCFAEGLSGMAYKCWVYSDGDSDEEVKKAAAEAYSVLSRSALRRWRELLQLWWRRAESRLGRLEDVINGH